MGIFNRQTLEQITQRMIDLSRGATPELTDFRVGSKVRTIYEAFAVVAEDFYDKTFKAVKQAIQQMLYTAFGFTPLPALSASGYVRLYAQNPPSADQPFYISLGTQVQAAPTSSRGPLTYQTTQEAYLYYNNPQETNAVSINGVSVQDWYYVDVPVVCATVGIIGNVGAGDIQTLVGLPSGIGQVTNLTAFSSGKEAETLAEQKARFQLFLASLTRGTTDSISYGAATAVVLDATNSFAIERVQSVSVVEGSGTFTVYVWNGVSAASTDLIDAVTKIITGYVDDNGNRVPGYKPAGITFTALSVSLVTVALSITVTPMNLYGVTDADVTLGVTDLRPSIGNVVSSYFSSLIPGQTMLISALESAIKAIPGVFDVKITTPADNVTATQSQILVPPASITYTKGTTV